VIGAGPAGVAMAVSLRDRGVRPLLIDRADEVGSSWRSRYDKLTLNAGRPFSHLPSRPYPKGTPMFPSRDQVLAHLDRHAHEDGIALRLATNVKRIDRARTAGASQRRGATLMLVKWSSLPGTPMVCGSSVSGPSVPDRFGRQAVEAGGQGDRRRVARRLILRPWRKGASKPHRQRRINEGGSGGACLCKRGGAGLPCQRHG
jgi:flavin-dependent dehydrogenase